MFKLKYVTLIIVIFCQFLNINVKGSTLTPEEGLATASRAVGHSEASAFEKFFRMWRRKVRCQWGLLSLHFG